MTGYVYAIDNGRGFVKIGWANDPYRRLAELNVASPEPMTLVGFVEGTKADEASAHRLLRASRVRGEWFNRTPSVDAWISTLTAPPPVEQQEHCGEAARNAVARIIDAFPTRTAFGQACGFTRHAVARASDMRRRGSIPVRYWQGVIDAARDLGRRDITHRVLADAHAPKMEAAE